MFPGPNAHSASSCRPLAAQHQQQAKIRLLTDVGLDHPSAVGSPGRDRKMTAPGLAGMLGVAGPARVQPCEPQLLPREAVQVARREGLHPCRPIGLVCLAGCHVKQCQTWGQHSTTHGSHLQPAQPQRWRFLQKTVSPPLSVADGKAKAVLAFPFATLSRNTPHSPDPTSMFGKSCPL